MARVVSLATPLAALLLACDLTAQMSGLDRAAIARAVAARMALKPGEKVLFVGRPGVFDTLTAFIRRETTHAGGQDMGVYATDPGEPEGWQTPFTRGSRGASRTELAEYLAGVDLAVMLPGAMLGQEQHGEDQLAQLGIGARPRQVDRTIARREAADKLD